VRLTPRRPSAFENKRGTTALSSGRMQHRLGLQDLLPFPNPFFPPRSPDPRVLINNSGPHSQAFAGSSTGPASALCLSGNGMGPQSGPGPRAQGRPKQLGVINPGVRIEGSGGPNARAGASFRGRTGWNQDPGRRVLPPGGESLLSPTALTPPWGNWRGAPISPGERRSPQGRAVSPSFEPSLIQAGPSPSGERRGKACPDSRKPP